MMARSVWLLMLMPLLAGGAPDCSNAGCVGTLTQEQCPTDTLLTANTTLGGCCPGCVAYIPENAACSVTSLQCAPGLVCIDSICKVSLDEDEVSSKCESFKYRDYDWSPKCEPGGTYAAVQCKGERLTGRCFCYSESGERIFGLEWWSRAENMTCACSRRVEQLRATGRSDVTVHCTEDGNFEALQCDDGVCWCAEPKWGDALGEVVPETLMELLPCYNKTTVGPTYLRVCDSANSALYKIRDEMSRHGTVGDAFVEKTCGLDGSYGEILFENGLRYCTWRDNGKIGSYMSSGVPLSELDCYCARDTKYFSEEGYAFTLQCQGSGSYTRLQLVGDTFLCIDKDGFPYAESIQNVDCPFLP